MRAYMRDQFPFLGIRAPLQKELARRVLAGTPRPDEGDLGGTALACWKLAEREYQYFACACFAATRRPVGRFHRTARYLVVTKPWWDTVDALAAHVVGPLVAASSRAR